jgi:hypothetical protein
MMRGVLPSLLALLPGLAGAEIAHGPDGPVTAPSGFDVTPHAVLYEEDPYSGDTLIVVRLIAPAVASPVLSANLQADMEWACETWGLPASDALSARADRIIVELMAEPVPRGEPAPETARFFESYSPEGDLCIWRLF